MIYGHVRDDKPYVTLGLPGIHGDMSVEFVLDTGFDGEFALPPRVLNLLETTYRGEKLALLPAAGVRQAPWHDITMDWLGEPRVVEILVMEGRSLVGMQFLRGMLIQIENSDGGEVSVEPLN